MRIERLALTDFRNLHRVKIDLRPRLNFLMGDNGQGKTNLLEAVYMLCRGSSFRAADSESLIRQNGPNRARIQGHFVHKALDYSVVMDLEPGKRTASVNDKRANSATLMARFPVVLFSPESLGVIKEGPEQRRLLVDEILVSHDPRQSNLLREFTRALRSRNRLLKNLAEGIGSRRNHLDSLASLNKIYFILASTLSAARIKALKDLQPEVQRAMSSIADDTTAEVAVDYVISGASALQMTDSDIYDAIRKRHEILAPQELATGLSLVGPHKHDIKLLFSGKDSRFYCSQGQQRALILALKIAQIVYHHQVHDMYPILLLDDVMSELDAKKRVNLMKFLEGISAQTLITATDLTWSNKFEFEANSIFSVTAGQVTGRFEVGFEDASAAVSNQREPGA